MCKYIYIYIFIQIHDPTRIETQPFISHPPIPKSTLHAEPRHIPPSRSFWSGLAGSMSGGSAVEKNFCSLLVPSGNLAWKYMHREREIIYIYIYIIYIMILYYNILWYYIILYYIILYYISYTHIFNLYGWRDKPYQIPKGYPFLDQVRSGPKKSSAGP